MLAVYLSPVYILLNLYILRWLLRWMSACSGYFHGKKAKACVAVVYTLLATALLTGFLMPAGNLQRVLKLIGNYWLGVMLYALLVILAADLIRLILRIFVWKDWGRDKETDKKWKILRERRGFAVIGAVCVILMAAACIGGAVNARIIRTTDYDISIDKHAGNLDELKIVLAADLHLGYNVGHLEMEQMVRKINAQKPDLVVIAGDIFDNEYEALDDPDRLISILKGIKSKYGTYACYGNHDIQEKILAGFTFGGKHEKKESDPRMDEFLKKAGITLLKDKGLLIADSFYLYGRPDFHRPGRGIDVRRTAEEITSDFDKDKPIIVIDHEPKELDELSKAGVDLDLCGHTHDGQTFPGNLTVGLMWENSYGYLRKGDMHNIVTSGVGVFGPFMRLGTKAEICAVDVRFAG